MKYSAAPLWSAKKAARHSLPRRALGLPEEELGTITVPFVCCSYDNSFGSLPCGRLSAVSIDDCATAYRAVSELIALGHRRIAALVAATDDRSDKRAEVQGLSLRTEGPRHRAGRGSRGLHPAASGWTRPISPQGRWPPAVRTHGDVHNRGCDGDSRDKGARGRGARRAADCSVIAVDGLLCRSTRARR